jgi:5-methylcytosine-specific restriction endonuclease McrA
MTWARIDDTVWDHPKVRALSTDAVALWCLVLSRVSMEGSDGVVSSWVLEDQPRRQRIADPDAVARELVRAGLWHDRSTLRRCRRCSETVEKLGRRLAPREAYVHDFLEYNPSTDDTATPDAKWKAARRRRLFRDPALCTAIKERDRWCCRYCHERVDYADHRTERGGTYDHVDPACRDNTLAAVVVACRGCNLRKGNRTPGEAGMPLASLTEHVAIVASRIHSGNESGSNPERTDPFHMSRSGRNESGTNPGSNPETEPTPPGVDGGRGSAMGSGAPAGEGGDDAS